MNKEDKENFKIVELTSQHFNHNELMTSQDWDNILLKVEEGEDE